jgi:hypothetical protein
MMITSVRRYYFNSGVQILFQMHSGFFGITNFFHIQLLYSTSGIRYNQLICVIKISFPQSIFLLTLHYKPFLLVHNLKFREEQFHITQHARNNYFCIQIVFLCVFYCPQPQFCYLFLTLSELIATMK